MKQILILEGEEVRAKSLVKIINKIDDSIQVKVVDNKMEAYKFAMDGNVHLFIADIILHPEIPGDDSGLQFAEGIRKVERYKFTPLIIISSLSDSKMFSYENIHCYSYIEEPFSEKEVKYIIEQALEFKVKKQKNKKIYFRNDGIIYAYNTEDIKYIENVNRQVTIYDANEAITFNYMTCQKILNLLDDDNFVQCSRNGIVNKQYISKIDKANRYIEIEGLDKTVEIGIVLKKKFMFAINNKS